MRYFRGVDVKKWRLTQLLVVNTSHDISFKLTHFLQAFIRPQTSVEIKLVPLLFQAR